MSEIGDRIYELRDERVPRLTQQDLADRTGLSIDTIQKLEQGRRAGSLPTLSRIAEALDVDLAALVGKPTHLESVPLAGGLLELRRALTPVVDPPGEPAPLEELRASLVQAWEAYWRGDYDLLATFLPGIITDARRIGAANVLAEGSQLAASTLVHLGHADLSLTAVDAALAAAEDPLLRAAAVGTRSWVLLNQARPADAAALAVREADAMEPRRKSAPEAISMYGNLLVTGATAAARAGDDDEARDLLLAAHGAAVRLGEDRNDYQTVFGVSQVVMQRVDAAVVAGDYVRALDVAAEMPRAGRLPLAARSRHKVDLAHAHASLGRYRDAERLLLEVEREAPRWMRYQAFPKAVVSHLLATPRPSSAVRGLARRLGVPR
ncbi:helix-turn-helix domain-containing protein [Actinoplanes teichomyceticus]|uniref:Transcriptional regulator with XRE-family HTH domain n=3 Tax=Actinoplanes teichomyceticus TaxID=1867 RepID=A0A561WAQ0_ACTTI|nr:helix-turn-helix transcriptional regulator [Actinoplanes teichomyceticus]TWG20937.1 transcriptional regulator with XRE-family HTH domain [Actinoplanes teichomyceticus]